MSKILVIDNFLARPLSFRDKALSLPFYDIKFLDGETYKRIHPRSTDEFKRSLEQAMQGSIEQQYSLLRLNYAGEKPNNAIHSDNDCGGYAAILYLSLPEHCQGGTALWRHRETGLEYFPSEQETRRLGRSPKRLLETLSRDWNRPEAWERTETSEMKFNRLIVYPANYFHSRWPIEAFGTKPENGRLIWLTFFQ